MDNNMNSGTAVQMAPESGCESVKTQTEAGTKAAAPAESQAASGTGTESVKTQTGTGTEAAPAAGKPVRRRRTFFYTLIIAIYYIIAKLFFFMRFEGRENIPEGQPVILMANHQTMLDPLTLGVCVSDREIHFMAKKELFENKILAWCFTHLHAFPVDRGNADMAAIRTAMNIIKEGNTLGIFPEGTRSKTGYMGPLLGGSSLLALKSGCEILPVYIDGNYRIFRQIRVIVGKPIEMSDLRSGRMNKETLDILTHRMEGAFAHLSGGKSLMPASEREKQTQNP